MKKYYYKNLVIKFNGLLAIGSLQQHSKKCQFSLISHLYCWMLFLGLSLHFNLNNLSGLSVTIKQTLSRDRGVCQLETAPLPSFPKVIPSPTWGQQACSAVISQERAPRVARRQHAPAACWVVLAYSRVSSLWGVVKHCFPPRHLLNTRL